MAKCSIGKAVAKIQNLDSDVLNKVEKTTLKRILKKLTTPVVVKEEVNTEDTDAGNSGSN